MQMMYEVIYKALEEVGLEKQYEPQDYLNFFCLGNRETQDAEGRSDVGIDSAANTPQVNLFLSLSPNIILSIFHLITYILDPPPFECVLLIPRHLPGETDGLWSMSIQKEW